MKILKYITLFYMFVSLTSCEQETYVQKTPNLCKINIFTYGNTESFDLMGVSINNSSSTSVLFNEEYKKLGSAYVVEKDDFKPGERNFHLLYFDESRGEVEISTYGIDVITRKEERKTLMIRIQSYDKGNQIIDTTFTFHSIYDDELPPPGSILDIETYQIHLTDYF